MNKHLLLGSALLAAISAYPQSGKLTKPSGAIEIKKKTEINESSTSNASSSFSGTVKQVKHQVFGNAKTTVVTCNLFTGSMNAFGYLVSQSKPLTYNPALGTVAFIARKSSTYTPSSNGNSGSIVAHHSTNLGTTWNYSCIWANATNLARYPQGGIYNPLGNTNPNNAYFVGMGPITGGSGWLGDWYASKQITTPGNTTPGLDQQAHLDASPTIKKHAMSRYSFTSIDGGLVRSMATVLNDINGTTNAGYGLRGAALVKGMFSAGAFNWSVDSFIPSVNVRGDGSGLIYGVPVAAWNDAGTIGYVVVLASRAGTGPTTNGYQPMVYKTTNSGASWSLLPSNDFADPVYFEGVYDRLYPTATNSNVICANFSNSEGFDVAVDVNGNLHLVTMLVGHYSNDPDSLGYRSVFGTEQYSYGYTGPFDYPVVYDFYTTTPSSIAPSGWDYHMVDSMLTEGPSGTSGQPGYGSNIWSDGSGAKMDQDARIQISRTDDGKKIFYSWTESDPSVLGLNWNVFPDLKMKGMDVTTMKVTPRMNVTGGVTNADQSAYYHYMSNKAAGPSSGCVDIPFTITYNSTYNGSIDVNTYYLAGAQVCPTSFSINPVSPKGLGASVNNSNAISYEVMNFPNPADHATTVVVGLKEAANFEVAIYNSIGQLVDIYKVNGQVGSNEVNINLGNYRSGIYFYNVKVGNSVVTKKLVVE
jgi:hypothetical protein